MGFLQCGTTIIPDLGGMKVETGGLEDRERDSICDQRFVPTFDEQTYHGFTFI